MDLTLILIVVGLGLTELLLTFYQLFRAPRRNARSHSFSNPSANSLACACNSRVSFRWRLV